MSVRRKKWKNRSRPLESEEAGAVDGSPHEMDALSSLVSHEMRTAVKLDVPLVVDVGMGPNWLETKR